MNVEMREEIPRKLRCAECASLVLRQERHFRDAHVFRHGSHEMSSISDVGRSETFSSIDWQRGDHWSVNPSLRSKSGNKANIHRMFFGETLANISKSIQ